MGGGCFRGAAARGGGCDGGGRRTDGAGAGSLLRARRRGGPAGAGMAGTFGDEGMATWWAEAGATSECAGGAHDANCGCGASASGGTSMPGRLGGG